MMKKVLFFTSLALFFVVMALLLFTNLEKSQIIFSSTIAVSLLMTAYGLFLNSQNNN